MLRKNISSKIRKTLSQIYHSRKDWRTKEKIIVIESDDWGSRRMPSKEAFLEACKRSPKIQNCAFAKYDGLETSDDFVAIHELLKGLSEKYGKAPKITANYIMANPDFNRIKKSGFKEYQREFLRDTLVTDKQLDSYKSSLNALIRAGYITPQLHGMEHVQVPYWMKELQNADSDARKFFDLEVYGISTTVSNQSRFSYFPAFDYGNESEWKDFMVKALTNSSDEFAHFFGFKPKSFIAPNYTWSHQVEEVLHSLGIEFIQSSRNQILPRLYNSKPIKRFLGESNKLGQIYLVRNLYLELSEKESSKKFELAQNALKRIELLFRLNIPVIISMHRLNFTGSIEPYNRDENLGIFHDLFSEILQKWPEVKFISSPELGEKIKSDTKYA